MVQNTEEATPKRRGRPRAYDPDAALQRAIDAFWKSGYSGTSLDEIAAATGMNRPSLYAAFGDKRALYLKALARYHARSAAEMRAVLADEIPVATALMRIYTGALDIYFSGPAPARGCFSVGTATTEAAADPEIGAILVESARRLDRTFEARIKAGQQSGEIALELDASGLASLAAATLHTIAIRARAGTPRKELETLARKATAAICGSAPGKAEKIGARCLSEGKARARPVLHRTKSKGETQR